MPAEHKQLLQKAVVWQVSAVHLKRRSDNHAGKLMFLEWIARFVMINCSLLCSCVHFFVHIYMYVLCCVYCTLAFPFTLWAVLATLRAGHAGESIGSI